MIFDDKVYQRTTHCAKPITLEVVVVGLTSSSPFILERNRIKTRRILNKAGPGLFHIFMTLRALNVEECCSGIER